MRLSLASILVLASLPAAAQTGPAPASLPKPAALELQRLAETWHALDFVAEKVWPGWTGYRGVPFLMEYHAFTVEGSRQPDGTWKTAVVCTPLFTLRAPRLRIHEAGDLVKIQVLARVKE